MALLRSKSRKRRTPFQVTRYGYPIKEVAIGRETKVNAGIGYSAKFEEFQACIAARLNIERWKNGGYDTQLKAEIIAWYVLNGEIETHVADAQQKKANKDAKRKRR